MAVEESYIFLAADLLVLPDHSKEKELIKIQRVFSGMQKDLEDFIS